MAGHSTLAPPPSFIETPPIVSPFEQLPTPAPGCILLTPGGNVLRIAQRALVLLCSTVLSSAFFPPRSYSQAKPATAQAQTPAQKPLPMGPPAPQSTHYPI